MDSPRLTAATALAQATAAIHERRTLQETLDAVVHATRTSVPAFSHVGISLRHGHGAVETQVGSDQLVWDLDALQYDLREGPSVEIIEHEPVVVVEHLRHEQRWPRYVPVAVERGVRSQVGIRLCAAGRHVGGLNLYSIASDTVESEWVETARLFAIHAAIALGHAEQEHHLTQALTFRKTIGQAIGIVMERYSIDEDRALQYLVRASSTTNTKLRDVATDVVTTANEKHRVQA